MKLAVLGGGGYRAPVLMKSLALRAGSLGIRQIVLMDIDRDKLERYGALARVVSSRINPELSVQLTSDAEEALRDTDYIITTIRAEGDEGRVFDERLALSCGVLGQETTGAGGFAMALRSIREIDRYCALAARVAKPEAVIFNFTNPSGLVTEAMARRGYRNVFGVCDGPDSLLRQIKGLLGARDMTAHCYGINHLSFFNGFVSGGRDVTREILAHPRLFDDTDMRLFDPELLSLLHGAVPNEYLYFYYYREKALRSILEGGKTRGETIRDINREMDAELAAMEMSSQAEAAFSRYRHYYFMRENSYFAIESGVRRPPIEEDHTLDAFLREPDRGGYAAVALDFIQARVTGKPVRMVLSVPSGGAMYGFGPGDVVETTCVVGRDGCKPLPTPWIPPEQLALMQAVKAYERLSAEAILEKDRGKAVRALTVHPLVGDYPTAVRLVDGYLARYRDYAGWQPHSPGKELEHK